MNMETFELEGVSPTGKKINQNFKMIPKSNY